MGPAEKPTASVDPLGCDLGKTHLRVTAEMIAAAGLVFVASIVSTDSNLLHSEAPDSPGSTKSKDVATSAKLSLAFQLEFSGLTNMTPCREITST